MGLQDNQATGGLLDGLIGLKARVRIRVLLRGLLNFFIFYLESLTNENKIAQGFFKAMSFSVSKVRQLVRFFL